MSLTGEFNQTFKELTPVLHSVFKGNEEERTLPKSLYEDGITLISKPDKDNTKKKNYRAISLIYLSHKSSTEYQQIDFNNV